MIKLSKRLSALAGFIPVGATFADIGTDHGFLAVYAVQAGISSRVVATDLRPGPLKRARAEVQRHGLTDAVDLRLGSGLTVLKPGEVDGVVIAGMGGETMVQILNASPAVVGSLSFLILQPMNESRMVREWLQQNRWHNNAEDLIWEDNRWFEAIRAVPGEGTWPNPIFFEVGYPLLANRHPLLGDYLDYLLRKNEKIIANLKNSRRADALEKRRALAQRIERLREVKEQWLRPKR